MQQICKLGMVLDLVYSVSLGRNFFNLYELVSRTIIDHHQGRIGVSSKLGEGSTFFLEIPLSNHLSGQESSACSEDRRQIKSLPLEKLANPHSYSEIRLRMENNYNFQRVLLVDDSKLNRKMLYRQLKNYFPEVVEVDCSCLFWCHLVLG